MISPPPSREKDLTSQPWQKWFSSLPSAINTLLTSAGSSVASTISSLTDIASRKHNDLQNRQGGTDAESYHFTSAEHSGLNGGADTTLHYHATDRDLANATGTLANASYLNATNTHTVNGDQEILTLDSSKMRTGTWSDPAKLSGDLYTLAGELVMFYQSHNVAIDAATGNFLGRDETDTCFLLIRTESGLEKQYHAPSDTAGTVPVWTLVRALDYATGSIILLGGIAMSGLLAAAGGVDRLATTGSAVVVSGAAPPSAGQVLQATSATNATWQTPAATAINNVINSATTIAADTSYIVLRKLSISSRLTVAGNVRVWG